MATTPADQAQPDDGPPAPLGPGAGERPPQRVAIVIPFSTLLVVLAFGLLVFLAVVSFGTLLSIFLAAVIALGLDPPVGALVRRGWKRGIASLVMFGVLFASVFVLVVVTAGPVWDQSKKFVSQLRQLGDDLSKKPAFKDWMSSAGDDETIKKGLQEV